MMPYRAAARLCIGEELAILSAEQNIHHRHFQSACCLTLATIL
jgi:hypothetical protein